VWVGSDHVHFALRSVEPQGALWMLECEPNDFLFNVKAGAACIQVARFRDLGFGFTIVLRIISVGPRHGTEGRKGFGSLNGVWFIRTTP